MTPRRVPHVGFLIWHLSIKWRVAVDRALNPLGITHAQYLLLVSLYEFSYSGAKPSQRELADFAGLEVVYVSKLVRALEHSGLLRRADHPDDPRAFELKLTAQGLDLVVRAATVIHELFDQLLQPIGGGTGPRHVALMRTLEALFDQAETLNRATRTQAPVASRQPPQPLRRSANRQAGTRK